MTWWGSRDRSRAEGRGDSRADSRGDLRDGSRGDSRGDLRDDAFCAFVEARSASLLRSAYLLTGSHARAEDLLQDVLLKVYLAWPRIRDLAAVEDYTRTALVRTHVSQLRRPSRREVALPEAADEFLVTRPGPASGAAGGDVDVEQRDELWTALARLGPRQRAVLVLRFYEDLPEARIAEVLGVSVGTVKSQTARGLARLAEHLTATPHVHPTKEER